MRPGKLVLGQLKRALGLLSTGEQQQNQWQQEIADGRLWPDLTQEGQIKWGACDYLTGRLVGQIVNHSQ